MSGVSYFYQEIRIAELERERNALRVERDQIRAENTDMRLQCGGMQMEIHELRAELEAIRGQQPDAVSVPRELLRRLLDSNNSQVFCATTYRKAHEELRALLTTKTDGA